MKTIQEYYKHKLTSALGNLGRRGDEQIGAIDAQTLINGYYAMYKLPEITLVNGGTPKVIPDAPSSRHNSEGSVKVTIRFDVEEQEKAHFTISLAPSNIEEEEKIIGHDKQGFIIRSNLVPITAKQTLEDYKQITLKFVERKNTEVKKENVNFRGNLERIVKERKAKLSKQSDIIKELAEIIPLSVKQSPISPLIPLSKKKKVTINPPKPKTITYPKIDKKILNAIIDVLIRGGKTFEQAPETFLKLEEEDLRNILISFLNGNFELQAVAEAFNKLGKTDISLRYSGDNLFVAECKFWGGQKLYSETIDQLFRYLTWRENIGVLITFVKEKELTAIFTKSKEATSLHPTYVENSMRDISDLYYLSRNLFPEDKEKIVEIHHLFFTIHSPRQ